MRRILLPQREVLNKMARDDYQVIDRKDRIFFRDIYDHLVRLHDVNESLRDLVGGAMDTYLSVINNRLNDVMKTLTLITTLFMPISFITGFFGMNFFEPVAGLVGWTSRQAFTVTLGIMLGLPIVMYIMDAPPHLGITTIRLSVLSPLPKSLTQNRRSSIIRSTNERRMLTNAGFAGRRLKMMMMVRKSKGLGERHQKILDFIARLSTRT